MIDLQGVMVFDASRLDLRQQELRIAADRGEQVVEILCDAAGEAADAFETLCAPEVALDLVAFRHVAEHSDVHAGQSVRSRRELTLAYGAVRTSELELPLHDAVLEQ